MHCQRDEASVAADGSFDGLSVHVVERILNVRKQMPDDVPVVSTEAKRLIELVMSEFTSSDDRRGFVAGGAAYKFDLDSTVIPEPAILHYLLRQVLGFKDLGRIEKTAWECVFQFHGFRGSIALQKFGCRLYLERAPGLTATGAHVLARAVRGSLTRAQRTLWRRVLADYAQGRLASGHVTLMNQSFRLRAMYDYFHDGAERSYAGEGRLPATTTDGWNRVFPHETEGFYNAVAAATSYFSWLEHVLVLSFAFQPEDDQDVDSFLNLRWSAKFRAIFNVRESRSASHAYRALTEAAALVRNPFAHGATDPRRGTVAFHLPGAGAVSMTLDGETLTPSAWLVPFDERRFQRCVAAFTETDQLLHADDATSLAMEWVESGMDVAFDSKSRSAYRDAASSPDDFQEFLRTSEYMSDMSANMDW
jgi:hypothetical protein